MLERFDDYVKWNLNGKVLEAIKCAVLAAGKALGEGRGWDRLVGGSNYCGWPDPSIRGDHLR